MNRKALSHLIYNPELMASSATAIPQFLSDVYDDASLCNKCSLCQATCPTYVTNPVEWETARGRVALIRDAIEGKIALRDIAEGPLSTCLTCDNCVAACPPRVPTSKIVSRARQELNDQEGAPYGQRFFLNMLATPRGLRRAHRVSRFAQVTGLRWAARHLGLTRLLGLTGAITEVTGPLPAMTARQQLETLPPVALPRRGEVTVMTCCYQNLVAPDATLATMRVLRANGYETKVPELGCFGLPAKTLGDREMVQEMAVRTTSAMSAANGKIVGDSASCVAHVRGYDDIVNHGAPEHSAAHALSRQINLASKTLLEDGLTAQFGPLRWKVAVDLPCSLPIDGPDRDVASQLLRKIPELQLVHLHEAAMCCGGPGAYSAQQPERSELILHRKFENVVASGADVLVTENVSCLLQLRAGARRYAPNVRVMHLMEVLDASLTAAKRRKPLPQ